MTKHRESADPTAARELTLFAVNDGGLYRQRAQPIIKNLARKMAKGVYNHDLACKVWRYLADDAAERYAKEYGGSRTMFNIATRELTAFQLCEYYFDLVEKTSLTR
jgi:hypothetical protein